MGPDDFDDPGNMNPAPEVGSEEERDDDQLGEIHIEDEYIIHDRENHRAWIQAGSDSYVDLSDWR